MLVQSLELHNVICIITPVAATTRYLCSYGGSFVECIKEELKNLLLLPSQFPVDRKRAHYLGQAHWDVHFSKGL